MMRALVIWARRHALFGMAAVMLLALSSFMLVLHVAGDEVAEAQPSATLSISKTSSGVPINIGQTETYHVTVTNTSNTTFTTTSPIVVSDSVPANFTNVTASGSN